MKVVAVAVALLACLVASAAAIDHSAAAPLRLLQEDDASSSLLSTDAAPVNWYKDHWCGAGLQFLDDASCAKVFPGVFDRSWRSTVRSSAAPDAKQGWAKDTGRFGDVKVNKTALGASVIGEANLCLILIKRVASAEGNGAEDVYYRYFCGENDDIDVHETWSSSKIYAMANAAGHLRTECTAKGEGNGFTSSTTGKHGTTPLGDLATVIASYDETAGYTSNGLSCYMHDLGWRTRIQSVIESFFPTLANLSLGGNYGVPTPPDLGFTLEAADGASCVAPKDASPDRYNSLSMLAHADLLRRLALYADIPPESRWPNITLDDTRTILYGAQDSLLFPDLQWGGMTADTAVFAQSAVDMTQIQADSQGTFRIFSKLGAGWSSSRNRGEIVSAVYAAWPVLDQSGAPIVDAGVEFILVGRASKYMDTNLTAAQDVLHGAINNVVQMVYKGQI